MDEEKKITDFRPSKLLYVFLFIYYSIWVITTIQAAIFPLQFGFKYYHIESLYQWAFSALTLIGGLLSFYAVIKILRGDSDCITALKWSLIAVLVYTLSTPERTQSPSNNIWLVGIVFFARPLFYLAFYLFLCFSKSIKERYPKIKRRYGPAGWIWAGLLFLFILNSCLYIYHNYQENAFCERKDITMVNLSENEVSDGYIAFSTNRVWHKCSACEEAVCIDDVLELHPTLTSQDSLSTIYLMSGRCAKRDVRTHNCMIVLSSNLMEERLKLTELYFSDTILANKRIITTLFTSDDHNNNRSIAFQITSIMDSTSPKCCAIIGIGALENISIDIKRISESTRFDLDYIPQSKDDINSNKSQYSQYYWIGNNDYQSDPNVFSSFAQSSTPRFSLSVALLKDYKREVAQGQYNNIFNYVFNHNRFLSTAKL